jgi:mycothiol synthase
MTTEVRKPMTPPLPEGVTLRRYRGDDDVPDMARILNEALADSAIDEFFSPEQMAIEMRPTRNFDPQTDAIFAEANGAMVGFARTEWVDTTDGGREHRIWGEVDRAWRRRGIGTALLAANIARSQEVAASHDTDRPRFLGSFAADTEVGCRALLAKAGFSEVRWFFHMVRPNLLDIPDRPLPQGIEIRPVTAADARQVFDADVEAFLDHWGGFDASDESFQNWIDSPDFDPSIWVVAFDGPEVAGAVINNVHTAENQALGMNRGWLDSVFTRRPWRGKGLARALVARSLEVLAARGVETAILGVDADNPTGALGVYTDNGFVVDKRLSAWRRAMEVGDANG